MPLLEALLIKGGLTIIKALSVKGVATKAGIYAVKSITTYGVGSTVAAACTIGIVTGGVVWTAERLDNLSEIIDGLQSGDEMKVIRNAAKIAIHGDVEVKMIPDAIYDNLMLAKVGHERAYAVSSAIGDLEYKIIDQVRRI